MSPGKGLLANPLLELWLSIHYAVVPLSYSWSMELRCDKCLNSIKGLACQDCLAMFHHRSTQSIYLEGVSTRFPNGDTERERERVCPDVRSDEGKEPRPPTTTSLSLGTNGQSSLLLLDPPSSITVHPAYKAILYIYGQLSGDPNWGHI